MGVRDPHIRGPVPLVPGRTAAGPALTLQCMPKREDLFDGAEYDNPELQLHRHVMFPAQAGDMVVVDARGDMGSGIFGEMMLTYLAGRGGAGVVDRRLHPQLGAGARARPRDLGARRHAQLPRADRAHPLRGQRAGRLRRRARDARRHHRRRRRRRGGGADRAGREGSPRSPASHAEWEEFSRLRLSQGGDLAKYYPLSAEAQAEYDAWRAEA